MRIGGLGIRNSRPQPRRVRLVIKSHGEEPRGAGVAGDPGQARGFPWLRTRRHSQAAAIKAVRRR